MLVSCLNFLLIGLSLLPQEAGFSPQEVREVSMVSASTTPASIHSWPLLPAEDWVITEADLEEEDSGESDAETLLSLSQWPVFQAISFGRPGLSPRGLGLARSAIRSPILRC